MTKVTRRFFLRGKFAESSLPQKRTPQPVRPPWSLREPLFLDLCTGCGDCVSACPENILMAGEAGRPVLNVSSRPCTFCQSCISACEAGALSLSEGQARPGIAMLHSGRCLSEQGTMCRICGEHCDYNAVSFRPIGGGRWSVGVDEAHCSGCGACIPVCPTKSLSLERLAPMTEAA